MQNDSINKERAFIIELVGPAAAGKTTFCKYICDKSNNFSALSPPSLSRTLSIDCLLDNLSVIKQIFFILPILYRLYKIKNTQRFLNISEISFLSILTGWHTVIRKNKKSYGKILIIDQGPIYMLSHLLIFGPDYIKNRYVIKYFESVYRNWANTLDMIIYFDTSDNYLIDRIRRRIKWHVEKDKDESEIVNFLALYRKTYKYLLSIFTEYQNSLEFLRFDTQLESLDSIVNSLLKELINDK